MSKRYTLGKPINGTPLYEMLDHTVPNGARATRTVIHNISNDCIISGGDFYNGWFGAGHYYGGEFHGGVFRWGIFRGGEYYGGEFIDGEFLGGTYNDGTFVGGRHFGGVFNGGEFYRGMFFAGEFNGGSYSNPDPAYTGNSILALFTPMFDACGELLPVVVYRYKYIIEVYPI